MSNHPAPAAANDPRSITNGVRILITDDSGLAWEASANGITRHPARGVLVVPSYMGFGPPAPPREPLPYSADGKPGTWRFA